MDSGAFAYCSNLSTLIIPSGLTSLSTLNEGSIFEGSGIKAVYVAWQAPVPAGQFFKGLDLGSPDKPGGLSIQLCKSEKKEFYIRYSS